MSNYRRSLKFGGCAVSESFAERLRHLFDTVHPKGRGPYSQAEVVEAIRAAGGNMTPGYMSQLLSGKRSSPSWTTLRDICRVFAVPMDYFNDDDVYEEIKGYIAYIQDLRDAEDQNIEARTYFPFRRPE
jgi:transcriptional regulator with XRE-family HTH domain